MCFSLEIKGILPSKIKRSSDFRAHFAFEHYILFKALVSCRSGKNALMWDADVIGGRGNS
jgi:hypothetical protein